jgi:hypothetical protein
VVIVAVTVTKILHNLSVGTVCALLAGAGGGGARTDCAAASHDRE